MDKKLYDSEWRLMELVWEDEPVTARELSLTAAARLGWNKNTTYTVLKKLVEKEAIRRAEPGFLCTSLVGREEARRAETDSLIRKLYGGSRKALFSSLVQDERLSDEELLELRRLLDQR